MQQGYSVKCMGLASCKNKTTPVKHFLCVFTKQEEYTSIDMRCICVVTAKRSHALFGKFNNYGRPKNKAMLIISSAQL